MEKVTKEVKRSKSAKMLLDHYSEEELLKDLGLGVNLDELEKEYRIYASECQDALDYVHTQINIFKNAIDRAGEQNPFDGIISRVKTFESVLGKCERRKYGLTIDSIKENVKDVAGIRIITKYIDEISLVKDMIYQVPGLTVDSVKDYVAAPKDNGYSSLHMGCRIQLYDPYAKITRSFPLEIQIRDRTMNLWSILQYDLGYKTDVPEDSLPEGFLPEVEENFQEAADYLLKLARKIVWLRDRGKNTSTSVVDNLTTEIPKKKGN